MADQTTLLSKIVNEAVAPALNQSLAEFDSIDSQLKPDTVGEGSTVRYFVSRPSNTWEGSNGRPAGFVQNQEKAVDVKLYNIATELDLGTVEQTNDVIDRERQIIAPLRVGMQRHLKNRFYNTALSTANYLINATSGNNGYWGAIQQAIAGIETYGLASEKQTILAPNLGMAQLQTVFGINFFSPDLQERVFHNKLGKVGPADLITTNIQGRIKALPQGVSLAIATAPSDGDGFLTCTVNGGTAGALVVPAGAVFTLSNVYALDLEGNAILDNSGAPILASFAVPVDVYMPASGSTIRLPLGKSIFTPAAVGDPATGPFTWQGQTFSNGGVSIGGGIATVSQMPTTSTTFNWQAPGKNVILVYGNKAMGVITATPGRTAAVDESVNSSFGVGLRTTIQWVPSNGNGGGGKTNFRMETIAGFTGVYSQACVGIILN